MHHCVGGYANLSSEGKYVVYSVKKDGERYSTIGFNRNPISGEILFNQHYKKFNNQVDCLDAKAIPFIIASKVNENDCKLMLTT
jgi:hypothetical protein